AACTETTDRNPVSAHRRGVDPLPAGLAAMLRRLFHSEIRANLRDNRGIALKELIWLGFQEIFGFRGNRGGWILIEYRIVIYPEG
ncbi:MAG: hypothetical protein ABTS16_03940, partial [Candidatus Accumulibacter phosphatis]